AVPTDRVALDADGRQAAERERRRLRGHDDDSSLTLAHRADCGARARQERGAVAGALAPVDLAVAIAHAVDPGGREPVRELPFELGPEPTNNEIDVDRDAGLVGESLEAGADA